LKKKRPLFLTLIGFFYIFGAVILLLSLGAGQEVGMAIRFGIPGVPEIVVRVMVALFSLIMAYGYLKLKLWGYWAAVIYSALFLAISISLITVYNNQPFIGNAIWSAIVLIYTFMKRNCFGSQNKVIE